MRRERERERKERERDLKECGRSAWVEVRAMSEGYKRKRQQENALPDDFFETSTSPTSSKPRQASGHGHHRSSGVSVSVRPPKAKAKATTTTNNNTSGGNSASCGDGNGSAAELEFENFLTGIQTDIQEIEKKEEEGKDSERRANEEDQDFEQLVHQGRAAVWRELVESNKKKKSKTAAKAAKKPSEDEDEDDEDEDDEELPILDWRAKGILK